MKIFNEDTRVKIPATIQFMRLGYDYQSLKDESIDIDHNTKIFVNRFKPSIEKINKRKFSDEEIREILLEIHNVIKNNDLGKEFYFWLINPLNKVKLIDFECLENNDFAVVDELPFNINPETLEGSFRPDINVLINGMPLAFLEVKKPNNEGGIQQEFNRMINKRLKNPDYKKYFNLIQIVAFSNNMEYEDSDDVEDVKAGSFYTTPNGTKTTFSFFREENKKTKGFKNIDIGTIKEVVRDCGYNPEIADTSEFLEALDINSPCNSFVTSMFDKERILYFLQYGIVFVDGKVPEKHIMRYPQFFATRKIIERLNNEGKGGIIWHTQGSGKTGLSAFSNRIIRDYYAKRDINTRFFFVVDRLDLLVQASKEFKNRGLNVINVNSKQEFSAELNKTLSTNIDMNSIGDITVVNIQKFEGEMPQAKNDYNAKVQRVFFIDEAHRSYSSTGEFFKNLMICDPDAIYIALTGTPLLSKKERSNLKFGDYIHKYFYDKSIADGYTLRIKKEDINTIARKEIKKNLELEDESFDKQEIYESDAYVDALSKFIDRDFQNFRLQNNDPTIGGMIVCRTNAQAKKVHEWFKKNSKICTGLVLSDSENPAQKEANKNNQIDFKETYSPDILVVHYMLTTGYDVKRLKKMYLLRGPKSQSLLQTISRVNRPYKSPNGKVYKYGYIVDFVDIEKEYDRTLSMYLKELENDINENGEDEGSLNGLIIDKEDINKKYIKYVKELKDMICTDNLEKFSKQLTYFNKEALFKIRHYINGIRECHTEFLLSNAIKYAKQIDIEHYKKLSKALQERIDFINLGTSTVSMMEIISNEEIVKIMYEFMKTKITIMDLSKYSTDDPNIKDVVGLITKIQNGIKKNKNKSNIKIINLDELLQKIFNDLSISDLDNLDDIKCELIKVLDELNKINAEEERLSTIYGGNYAFVKVYSDCLENHTEFDKSDIETMTLLIYDKIKEVIDKETLIVQGRQNFIDNVKKQTTKELLLSKLYKKLNLKEWYDQFLSELYINLQLYK